MMNASVLTFVREECYYPVKKFLPGTYLCFGKIFLRFHASGLTQIIDHVYDISRVGSNRGRRLTVFFCFLSSASVVFCPCLSPSISFANRDVLKIGQHMLHYYGKDGLRSIKCIYQVIPLSSE